MMPSHRPVRYTWLAFAAAYGFLWMTPPPAAGQQTPQQPRFRSSVEVTSVDVAVVDGQGKPMLNLQPSDFTVRIDNKVRPVVNAEWVPLALSSPDARPAIKVPFGYSSNENSSGGRLLVIAVDEPHIRPGGAAAVMAAASAFIDRLSPSDRVAAVSLGLGGGATPFVSDRERIKTAIGRMAGQWELLRTTSTYMLTPGEVLEISDGNRLSLDQVAGRECSGARPGSPQMLQCRQEIEAEAQMMAQQVRRSSDMTINGLRELLKGLNAFDGPKTLVLMSEGFNVRDTLVTHELGTLAAATRTSIYALKLDNQLFDITESRAPIRELNVGLSRSDGLEGLAYAARGTLFTVTGTGSELFETIEAELSGYYLLGVESEPSDRDGKQHAIRIDVSRRGATVRTRRQLLNVPSDLRRPRSRRDAALSSLSSPLLMSALPIRVATFALRGPERERVQLLIHAEVGSDYAGPAPAVVAYTIQDRTGRTIDNNAMEATLLPVMNGVPGALHYAAGASLVPGDYSLKLAVAEGDRVGSVEHTIHAALVDAGEVTLSELMVGGPSEASDRMRPTVGYMVSYGFVHGYMEAYGPHLEGMAATYEVAKEADGPALMSAESQGRPVGEGRMLFTEFIPVVKLPPGQYFLRASVTSSGEPLKTLTRPFEIAPPAVLMTSAAGSAAPAPVDLFLPIDERRMVRPFKRDAATAPAVLDAFQKRVPEATKAAFDQGLAEFQKGNFVGAELGFKRAIRPEEDSTAALAYLAASFASAGRDAEAASVWQTALVDGGDFPQIYEWLADTLVRAHDYSSARSILEEAADRWPTDTRFNLGLAVSYATLGRGRDAVRVLDRYIADGHADPELLALMVEWIYQIHSNRAVVVSANADLAMARDYAARYAAAKGPKQALVKQWMDYLEGARGESLAPR